MDDQRDAFTITEFCARHGFSRATYYNLTPDSRPREMRIHSRVLITREAAAEWRRRMEGLTDEPAA